MATNMHRLQISLPEEQMDFLRERSRESKKSVAGVIRELIEQEARLAERPITEDPIWEVIGIGQSQGGDRVIDADIYSKDWYNRTPQTGLAAIAVEDIAPEAEAVVDATSSV